MKKRYCVSIILSFFLCIALLLCLGYLTTEAQTSSLTELIGGKIASTAGGNTDKILKEYFGDSTEVIDYNSYTDGVSALLTGKVQAVVNDLPSVNELARSNDALANMGETLGQINYAAMFPKTDEGLALSEEFSAFLATCQEDGTITELESKWFESDDETKRTVQDASTLVATKGTLTVSTDPSASPMNYINNGGNIVGYEIDLLLRFCAAAGYGLNLQEVNGSTLINEVASNRFDMIIGSISMTDERAELAYFSSPTYTGPIAFLVLADENESISFTNPIIKFVVNIIKSFKSTFIEQGRWSLFLEGLTNTLLISFLSMVLGSVVGIVLYLLSRLLGSWFSKILEIAAWIVSGVPEVVVLLVVYYVIFGQSVISGVNASVITFTFIFSFSMAGILSDSFERVKYNQVEAAMALGYGKQRAYNHVVFPQALRYILPQFKSIGLGHIKASAVVGYIAVHDLTKVGDIIRSINFESFFVLITTAVIYIIIELIFTVIMNIIIKKSDYHNRNVNNILKGVKTR